MPRTWLALAVALHVVLAGAYAWRTPSFEAPDENAHYEYAQHVANAQKLPLAKALAAQRGLPQTEQVVLGHHAPLYYAILAATLVASGRDDTVFGPLLNPAFADPAKPARFLKFLHGQRAPDVLLLLRAVSVVLGAISLVLLHRLGRACCPATPRVADLAVLLTACLPAWSFLHGTLNNDVLVVTLATATMLALVRMLRAERVRWTQGAAIGALLGAALLTKLTALFLVPLSALAFVVRWRGVFAAAAVACAAAVAVAGWWFVRNHLLYGDPLATSVHDAAFAAIPPELRWTWLTGDFPRLLFPSLFGRFGWFSLPPQEALVWIGAAVAGSALAGLVRYRCTRERAPLHAAWLLVAAIVLVGLGTAWFNWTAPQPQGRLLLPAAGPAAVLLAAGLVHLTAGIPKRRWLATLPPLAAAAVFFAWFAPAFAIELAPAPPWHRSLVGGITAPPVAPTITWRDTDGGRFTTPPTLRWNDPGAPAGTRYALYAFDAAGRVHLATHEWSGGGIAITGTECVVPDVAWSFLPHGEDLWLRLRRVPTTVDEDPALLPTSPPWRCFVE